YAENKNCIVCEEHCPVHKKAILFDPVQVPGEAGEIRLVKRPRVVEARCIGCGICEHVCPVPGAAAIRVAGRGSRTSPGSGYA
ncbi:MAG: 4Fe-4S dicluster domain-containing protein, partial [Proteobacteria bacterium]|nr:4Fe-4S dicluster domain-containing protein [Pseudomonadota bacterium]